MTCDLKTYLAERRALVENRLFDCLPTPSTRPARLAEAIGHAVRSGGKRLRPILALAAAEAAALAAARATRGQLDVIRSRKMTGWCYSVELFVDGRLSGNVGNGQSVQISMPAGRRTIEARGGGLSGKLQVDVQTGQTSRVKVYFSDLGFLGGGLVVKPA